ncbi:MAG: hypothetical protein M5U25_16275 [Planctomycetota bacterium]|nr:hypothetical protein [Planctomycetota bacterium]
MAAVEEKRVQQKPAKAAKSSGKVQAAQVEPPQAPKPRNPSPAEKKRRAEFLVVIERTHARPSKKYKALAEDALKLSRFAQVLALSDDKADEVLYAAGKTSAKVDRSSPRSAFSRSPVVRARERPSSDCIRHPLVSRARRALKREARRD